MTDSTNGPAEETADREIQISRVFDAPPERVFAAWTDPKQVAKWWGPHGFTSTTNEMDVKPGGVWRFVMHGPGGLDCKNEIVFVEVVKPERLVYRHIGDKGEPGQFLVRVTFDEQGIQTKVTVQMVFGSPAECDKAVASGAVQGGNQSLDRLSKHLARI